MKKVLIGLYLLFISSILSAQNKAINNTRIYGIVIESDNYKIIEDVKVFYNNEVVCTTDSNGYFDAKIQFDADANEGLKISFSKPGYPNLSSFERWNPGLYDKGVNYLIGLESRNNNSFTSVTPGDLSYDQTLDKLEDIKSKKYFNSKLDNSKKNNQNSVFEIDGNYYMLSNSNWVEINSLDDSVRINNKKTIPIKNLNTEIKRSQINSMSPDEFKVGLYHIEIR